MSNYSLCYEPIQRTYRTAIVRAARGAMQKAYPADWQAKLHAPFKKEWADMVANANERRQTGQLSSQIVDDFDYLGVNHFHSLFEAYFNDIFPRGTDVSDRARQQEKQAILSWAREIRALRDPLSHPSEEDLPFGDCFRMLDSAQRILAKLDFKAADDVKRCLDQLTGASDDDYEVIPLEGYLPPAESIATRFVGRKQEINELRALLDNPRTRQWALMGDGGKGKTAIAYEFAAGVKETRTKPFQFVIWLSAKRKQFLQGQTVDVVEPDFWNLTSAVNWILIQYGWGIDESLTEDERQQLCLQLFNEFPALLVVDDLDSLEGTDDDAIRFFTAEVPATSSKVLFTSRRQLFGFGNITTVVAGFDEQDGSQFIETRIKLLRLDPNSFNDNAKKQILQVTDGSPLYIEDLLRLCATGEPPVQAIKVWRERAGDDARRYALSRELDLLSDNAKDVLTACGESNRPISLSEIQDITGLSNDSVHGAIEELQRLFLVPRPRLVENVERFDLTLNTRGLVRSLMNGTDRQRAIQNAFKALSGELTSSVRRRPFVGSYIRQAVALVKQNRHAVAEDTLLAGLKQFPNDPDLLGQIGWLYKTWKPTPRYTDARERFVRAHQLNSSQEDMYAHWAEMEVSQQEWTKAAEAAEFGLDTCQIVYD